MTTTLGMTGISARQVRAAYATAGRGDRFHVAVRLRSCPFPRIEAHVPRAGRVLDLGCGHGVFSLFLASSSPQRAVVGVDVDVDKLVTARAAADRSGLPVTFAEAVDGAVPDGPWDAVTVVDVLYLLGVDAALDLVGQAAAVLAPGGVLVIKEVDVQPRWKYRLTRWQEIVSTRVTRITQGEAVDFVPPDQITDAMTAAGLSVERHPLDRGAVHPHLLLVGRRPEAVDG